METNGQELGRTTELQVVQDNNNKHLCNFNDYDADILTSYLVLLWYSWNIKTGTTKK